MYRVLANPFEILSTSRISKPSKISSSIFEQESRKLRCHHDSGVRLVDQSVGRKHRQDKMDNKSSASPVVLNHAEVHETVANFEPAAAMHDGVSPSV